MTHQETAFEAYIPTILKLFLDEEVFTEQFLIDWDSNKIPEIEKHYLFDEKRNTNFKESSR